MSLLDEAGKARLKTDLKKCSTFRSNREQSFNRCAVEDDRSPVEVLRRGVDCRTVTRSLLVSIALSVI
jgi:hypothetical protein